MKKKLTKQRCQGEESTLGRSRLKIEDRREERREEKREEGRYSISQP
jgi:hypothetical protein